nr:right-handed parallel beta-helix repeat-containing protein [Bacteroidota bacterium]
MIWNHVKAQPIIANHETTHLEEIPPEWIDQAKSDFRIWYGHTSHGSQITTGIQNLESHYGEPYTFNSSGSGGALSYQELDGYDLGQNGDLTWYNLTVNKLNNPSNDRNVVIWSWCGGVSGNTPGGIDIYLNAMNQLEQDYPDVQFVYMTGHLDIWSWSNLKARNQQIRDYCTENNKILFDFADIESYNPDGTYFEYATDNCDYYEGPGWGYLGNWANEWCTANPGSDLCWSCSCAHSQSLNCNLKGRAFWWMLARMAGWGADQDVFYVNNNHPEASDENPGTPDLPWQTIQHAANVVQPGDSVVIREGIYYESVSTQTSGNETDGYIVFAAYPGEDVIIDGTGTGMNTGIYLENSFIKLYGLVIRNWDSTGIWAQDVNNFVVQDCELHDMTYGIGIAGNSHDFLISGTEVHHFDLYGIDASPFLDDYCYNGTFINCTAHSARDAQQNVDGFALGHGEQNNFLFDHCTTYGVFDGFDISSSHTTLNSCLSYDCWNTCYKLWEDQVELVNCIGYSGDISIVQVCWSGNPTETILRNCTFYDAEVYTIWVGNSNDILNMYNCIISGGENIGLAFEQTSAGNYHGDFNLFQNNNPARAISVGYSTDFSISQIETGEWALYSGQDANSVVSDLPGEIFLNPATSDLHLTALSPAVNNGSMDWAPEIDFEGNIRPFGSAPDIGAYESQNLLSYAVDPMNINFGTVFIGESQMAQITITNNSGIPVIFDNIEVQPEVFDLSEMTFPLEVDDSFSFTLIFEPDAAQSYSGSIAISSAQTYNTEVTLSGTGINEPSGGYHVSGEVSGMWQTYDSIFVDGDIIVPNGQTLTVTSVPGGIDFMFTGHYKFIVYGQLELLGNEQDSIRLWSLDRDEGWFGLRFYDLHYNTMDSSRVRYCSFKYGNATGEDWDNFGGALFIYESSKVIVEHSTITENSAGEGGGGIHIRYSSPIFRYLSIMQNTASAGGGIQCWGSYPQLERCLICLNTASEGGGIDINGCGPFFDHCTVSQNTAGVGSGINMYDWSYPEFTNSIIWGNTGSDIHVLPDGGDLAAAYSDVGGTGVHFGTGNINEDPLFANPAEGNFELTWANYPVNDNTKSPCINSGDPAFPTDPDGSVTDMGALTFFPVGNHIPGGEVSGTWNDMEEICVDGDLVVPQGEVLEIQPVPGGTDIIFTGPYSITVYGQLLVIGNTNDIVFFNAEDTETGWRGIKFINTGENGQGNSEIHYCSLKNVKNISKDETHGGAISAINSSNLIINNSTFTDNEAEKGGAIAIFGSMPELFNLSLTGNYAEFGGGLYIEDSLPALPPQPTELLHSDNLSYCGAFRLPEGSGGSNWNYSGSASTFFPDGDAGGPTDGYPGSIFAVGHDWYFDVSEINIPIPVISANKNLNDLNTAETMQPFADVTNGVFNDIAYEVIRMGLAYLPAQGQQNSGKIYMCVGQHFQFDLDYSHIWFDTDLSSPQMAGPWYFGNYDNYRTNDFMFTVPDAWANNHVSGQKLICGRYRDGGWSGKGPNLFTFAPWTEGNPPNPDYHLQNITHLLGYTQADSLDGYKHADEWNGGAWLTFDSLSAVMIIGTKALGDCWYGFGDGTRWPNDSSY